MTERDFADRTDPDPTMTTRHALGRRRAMLNKVPEITLYFWIIKVLCTTVGETAADFLNVSLNLGLTGTSLVTGIVLVVSLAAQFSAKRYVPARYWLAVTLVSIFGTLVTDNLTTAVGLPLEASTLIFGALLALTFLGWYAFEKTLSIHSILTVRRETFYWLAILVTFALGTATGDLMAEALGLGYPLTGIIVASLIALFAIGRRLGLNPVLTFWAIYILTRPLGASIGDFLSQSTAEGGLGLGPTVTSVTFLVAIVGVVTYLAVTKVDAIRSEAVATRDEAAERGALWQTVVVVVVVVAASSIGYAARSASLQNDASSSAATAASGAQQAPGAPAAPRGSSPLGDLSSFRVITQDTLHLLDTGDQSAATSRIADLETEWDRAQARLKAKDDTAWTDVDGKIDTALRELRSTSPDPNSEKAALTTLVGSLG